MAVSHAPITDYLRETYRVTDVDLSRRGKHCKCAFTYNGKRVTVTLPLSPSDANWVAIKKGDIRRALGPPPPPANGHAPRKLEAMTQTLVASAMAPIREEVTPLDAPIPALGCLAHYATGLRFIVPEAFARHLGLGSGLTIKQVGAHVWRLTPRLPAWRVAQVRHDARSGQHYAQSPAPRGMELFGVSPADYRAVGTAVEVTLRPDELVPVSRRAKQRSKATPVVDQSQNASLNAASRATPAAIEADDAGGRTVGSLPATGAIPDPKSVLAAIARIEAETPYRLARTKDTGAWVWAAPRIEL
jgi:hypothetical protein